MSEKATKIGRFQIIANTYKHGHIHRAYVKIVWPRKKHYVEAVTVRRYVETNRWAFWKGGTAWQFDFRFIATFMVMVYHEGCSVAGIRFEISTCG